MAEEAANNPMPALNSALECLTSSLDRLNEEVKRLHAALDKMQSDIRLRDIMERLVKKYGRKQGRRVFFATFHEHSPREYATRWHESSEEEDSDE